MENKEFYNTIANRYNEMIPLDNQIESKKKFFENFINEEFNTAVDLGCGSGADSIALARLGINVTAVDPSDEMIKEAQTSFKKFGVDVNTINSGISDIPANVKTQFNFAVSLGNTFANINKEEVYNSIERIHQVLTDGGKLLIQLLNYDVVLRNKERIVNITQSKEKSFVRFYDFYEGKIFFNILSYNKSLPAEHQLITTEIFPYDVLFFENTLTEYHFRNIKYYGNMKLDEFNKDSSKNLIVVAEK